MAECTCAESSESSESFGTAGSPPSTPSDDSATSVQGEQRIINPVAKRQSRPNTIDEKRAMRKERKKRLRRKIRKFKVAKLTPHAMRQQQTTKSQQHNSDTNACTHEQKDLDLASRDTILYKQMAHDYWDRWQWEVCQRKKEKRERCVAKSKSVHQIDPSHLLNPIQDGKTTEAIIGRGSFSIVQLKVYRGMRVAVKQFRTQSLKEDVLNEALHLNAICHPYLPYLLGVCSATPPYRIVTQFHGVDGKTMTLQKEIHDHHRQLITTYVQWMNLCIQLLEAINYLHCQAQLLHNDIKGDNILLSDNPSGQLQDLAAASSSSISSSGVYHVVLIDFGKATHVTRGRVYNLTEREKEQYVVKFPHYAPEVINGNGKQTIMSDMYAVGVLLKKMSNHGCFGSLTSTERGLRLIELIDQCKSADINRRLSAIQCIDTIKTIIEV